MKTKRNLASAMALVMMLSTATPAMAAPTAVRDVKASLIQNELAQLKEFSIEKDPSLNGKKETEQIRVIVELKDQPVVDYAIARGMSIESMNKVESANLSKELNKDLDAVQKQIDNANIKAVIHNEFVNVFNGFSATVSISDAKKIEKMTDVKRVVLSAAYEKPETEPVRVEPHMGTSVGMVNAPQTWDLKYKGEGMLVAVMDSSFDPEHPSMQLISNPELAKIKSQADIPTGLPGTFRNLKMPYAYNYFDNTQNLPSASDHGTHVAGTVGANGDPAQGQIKGVAPEAQILGMKVFGDDPTLSTTYDDIYVRAIDDAIKLGADVINMSLGSTAGFVMNEQEDPARVAIRKATESGIVVNVSSGNSNKFGSGFADPLASNPDVGVVGSPSLNPETITIASVENTHLATPKLVTSGAAVAYMESGKVNIVDTFMGQPVGYEFCGLGLTPAEFEGKKLAGKIALIQRGVSGFGVKVLNAQNAGAAGVIVFNSTAGGNALMGMSLGDEEKLITIPAIFIGLSDGEKLKTAVDKTVTFNGEMTTVVNANKGKMATSSSWGTTPNLDFKPEMTAPGAQIYSTLQGGGYGLMSGTSMAAPHAAGGSALVLQRIDEAFKLKGKARFELAKNLLMSTAHPLIEPGSSTFISPRKQGAGVMDVYSAVTSKMVIVDPTTNLSKVALKAIKSPLIAYNLVVKNLGNEAVTYNLSSTVATDLVLNGRISSQPQLLEGATVKFLQNGQEIRQLPVAPQSQAVFTVQMDISNISGSLTKQPFATMFPNGGFVEGFVTLKDVAEVAPSLGVPYMGFYGDWNAAPILDVSIYDVKPTQMPFYGAGFNALYTETAPAADGKAGFPFLGTTYDGKVKSKDLIAISPNGDGYGDYVGSFFTLLRNAKEMEINIYNQDGVLVRELSKLNHLRKNYFDGNAKNPRGREFGKWDGKVNDEIVQGTYIYEIKARVDSQPNQWQVSKYPVVVDNTAPVIESLVYDEAAKKVTVKAKDNFKVKYYALLINDKMVTNNDSKGKDQPDDNLSGIFNVEGLMTPGAKISAVAFDFSYNMSIKEINAEVPVENDGVGPVVNAVEPSTLSYSTTKTVKFTGTATDPAGVKTITIAGKEVPFTTDKTTGISSFSKELTLEEGRQDIKISATDSGGNATTYEKKFFIDATSPKVVMTAEIAKVVDNEVKEITLNGTFSDNYLGATLNINGNEIGSIIGNRNVPVPVVVSKDFTKKLPLKEGDNVITIKCADPAGNQYLEKFTVCRLKAGEVVNGMTATITPKDKVSYSNPLKIDLAATRTTVWKVAIVDPNKKTLETYTGTGLTFEKTWRPEESRKLNGRYQVVVTYTQLGKTKTEAFPFEVYNYPIAINKVDIVKRNGVVSVEADLTNFSADVQNPMMVVQVTDDFGQVISISTAKIKNLVATQNVTLTSSFAMPSYGYYKVEVFVWTGWDNARSLASKVTKQFLVD